MITEQQKRELEEFYQKETVPQIHASLNASANAKKLIERWRKDAEQYKVCVNGQTKTMQMLVRDES